MCANFIYDLNGPGGPNQVGKDIGFMTAFYPTDSHVVMPIPSGETKIKKNAYPTFSIATGNQACHDSYGTNTKMANIEELMSLFINRNLGYISSDYPYFISQDFFASSTVMNGKYYGLIGSQGSVYNFNVSEYHSGANENYNLLYCVKK